MVQLVLILIRCIIEALHKIPELADPRISHERKQSTCSLQVSAQVGQLIALLFAACNALSSGHLMLLYCGHCGNTFS